MVILEPYYAEPQLIQPQQQQVELDQLEPIILESWRQEWRRP